MNTRGLAIVCIGNLLVWYAFYRVHSREGLKFTLETIRAAFIALGTCGLISSVFHLAFLIPSVPPSHKGMAAMGVAIYGAFLLTDVAYICTGAKLKDLLTRKPERVFTVIFANGAVLTMYTIYLTCGWVGRENVAHPAVLYLPILLIRMGILVVMAIRLWRLADEFNPPSKAEIMRDYSSYE